MAAEVKGPLGFDLSHHYIAIGVIWVVTVRNTSPEITECTHSPQ
jgi:hypothetical protein